MDDSISIPRSSAEALIQIANEVLSTTAPSGPNDLERGEVTLKNNIRKNLKEAVYQAEKAVFDADSQRMTSERLSENAEKRRQPEDDYSQSKENWIAR
jgi:hypothetical protein